MAGPVRFQRTEPAVTGSPDYKFRRNRALCDGPARIVRGAAKSRSPLGFCGCRTSFALLVVRECSIKTLRAFSFRERSNSRNTRQTGCRSSKISSPFGFYCTIVCPLPSSDLGVNFTMYFPRRTQTSSLSLSRFKIE